MRTTLHRPSPRSSMQRTPRPVARARPIIIALAACALAGSIAGCARGPAAFDARQYPDFKPQDRVVDVQVSREVRQLRFTNTSARELGPGRLWINQQFSHPLERVDPGETVSLDLGRFVNEFGEPFRAGGFFATRRPKPVVLVQVEPGGEDGDEPLVGLVLVSDEAR